jgi:signal transduction histidine kinase
VPGHNGLVLVGIWKQFRAPSYTVVKSLLDIMGNAIAAALVAHSAQASTQHTRRRNRLLQRAANQRDLEAQRLRMDLHDGPAQRMAAASLYLQLLADSPEVPQRQRGLARQAAQALHDALMELRGLMADSPDGLLDGKHLVPTIEREAYALQKQAGWKMECHLSIISLSPEVARGLFQIAREALQNVSKHAGASLVVVTLEAVGKRVVLTVRDDGCGFEPRNARGRGMGLDNMRQRALLLEGRLRILSKPGLGTTVRVSAPLAKSE